MRNLKVKVKSAKGRTTSSTRWLQRQLNDPFVSEARLQGFRSRSAFKLLEIDDKFNLLKKGNIVLDLGCAPGGWCQVAAKKVGVKSSENLVTGLDLKQCDAIVGVTFLETDFLDEGQFLKFENSVKKKFDVILSDMAPNATGHKKTDNLQIMALVEAATDFAVKFLKQDGSFVAKVLDAGAGPEIQKLVNKKFEKVINFKPKASRSDSSERYLVAIGFKEGE
jgi:23S rRNA (uridine2552-2'-O)-methyltransferase